MNTPTTAESHCNSAFETEHGPNSRSPALRYPARAKPRNCNGHPTGGYAVLERGENLEFTCRSRRFRARKRGHVNKRRIGARASAGDVTTLFPPSPLAAPGIPSLPPRGPRRAAGRIRDSAARVKYAAGSYSAVQRDATGTRRARWE